MTADCLTLIITKKNEIKQNQRIGGYKYTQRGVQSRAKRRRRFFDLELETAFEKNEWFENY